MKTAGTVRSTSLAIPTPVPSLGALTHHHGHSPSHCLAGVLLEGQGSPPQWWEGGPFQVPLPPKCGGVQALGSQGMWLQGAAQDQHSLSRLVAAREQQPPTQQALETERQIRGLLNHLNTIPMPFHSPPSLTFALVGSHWMAGRLLGLTWLHGGVWLAGSQEGD